MIRPEPAAPHQRRCPREFSAQQNRPVRVEQSPTGPPVVAVKVGSLPNKSCGSLVEVGNLAGSVSRVDRCRKGFEQVLVIQFLLVSDVSTRAHSHITIASVEDPSRTLGVALMKR